MIQDGHVCSENDEELYVPPRLCGTTTVTERQVTGGRNILALLKPPPSGCLAAVGVRDDSQWCSYSEPKETQDEQECYDHVAASCSLD